MDRDLEELIDAGKSAGKALGRWGWKKTKSGARIATDKTVATSKYAWNNAYPGWKKYGFPTLTAAATYFILDNLMSDTITPHIQTAVDFVAPALNSPSSWLDESIQSLYTPEQSWRNVAVALVDGTKSYVSNNFAGLVQNVASVGTAVYTFLRTKENFPQDLTIPITSVQKLKNKAVRATSLAGNALAIGTLIYATQPGLKSTYDRVFGQDMTPQFEELVAERKPSTNFSNALNEILLSGKVTKERMQKDAAYLRSIGLKNITDEDLFYAAKMISAEAGPSEDAYIGMVTVAESIFSRYALAQVDDCLRGQFFDEKDPSLKGLLLKGGYNRKKKWIPQFEPSIRNRNKQRWAQGYSNGSLTYKTNAYQHGRDLLAYFAALVAAEDLILNPNKLAVGGAPNFLNEKITGLKWEGSPICGNELTKVGEYGQHTFYTIVDKDGNNVSAKLRREFAQKSKLKY